MNIRLICQTTKAMTTNVMTALRNEPQRMATSVAGSPPTASLRTSEVGEVDAAEDHADRRHDDVLDQRGHDRAERGADDDADRQRQGVGLEQEPLELGQHGRDLRSGFGSGARQARGRRVEVDATLALPSEPAASEAMTGAWTRHSATP